MSDEIAYATIRELGTRYRRRELSPVEVTRALLARIEKVDTALRAFVTLTTVGAPGSEAGGSIRGPAAFCGIVGLKPTYGRVSRAGVLTLSWTLDHTGPMARTVEDCAYLLQAMAGHDPADPASSRAPVDDYLAPLGHDVRGLRIGVPRAYFFEGIDPEVERAFEEALETLRGLGAQVRDVEVQSFGATPSFLLIMMAEAFAYHERDIRQRPELYG